MMEAAHRREFDVIVVWVRDRFGRSVVGNLQVVLDLDRCGVDINVNESWVDTGGPALPGLCGRYHFDRKRVRGPKPNLAHPRKEVGARAANVLFRTDLGATLMCLSSSSGSDSPGLALSRTESRGSP